MGSDEGKKTRVTAIRKPAPLRGTGRECLVQIYGEHLGERYPADAPSIVLGRSPDADIVVNSDTVSRFHARIQREEDGGHALVDLRSTNGTYINDFLITRERLCSGDLIRVGDTIFKYLSGDNVESAYHEEIYRMTIHDGLTQISNKRYLNEFLDREFIRARRHARDLSVLMFDIDHFKRVNDRFGHLTGDFVLQELAALIRRRIRRDELFARAGGEEFVIALPESPCDVALRFAEYVRQMVEQHVFHYDDQDIPVTISIGVASLNDEMQRSEDLLRAADRAMYRAKAGGRNAVRS